MGPFSKSLGIRFCLLAVFLLFLPSSAFAHVERGQTAGLATGLRHPWQGQDLAAELERLEKLGERAESPGLQPRADVQSH